MALAATFVVAVGATPAFAATNRYVSTTGSDTVPTNNQCTNSAQPCRTITRAHAVAVAGDTILVSAGTYVERPTITKGVTIDRNAAGPAGAVIIDGNNAGSVVTVNLAAGQPTFTLNNVTITKGLGGSGFAGGMSILAGTVVVNDTIVTANNTTNGTGGAGIGIVGTLFGTTQNVTLNRVTVSNNTATNGNGGGIWSASTFTMNDSTITGNKATTGSNTSAGLGGGITLAKLASADTPGLNASGGTISLNTATNGGGLYSAAPATLTNVTVTQNAANAGTGIGGGAEVVGATLTLSGATVSKNSAGAGGGVGVPSGATLQASNNTVFDQNTGAFGAGLYNAGTSTISGSSFTSNASSSQGGAIWDASFVATDHPKVTLTNTTLTANTAASLSGGVVVATNATFTMTGGSLSNSTAPSAGGLYVQSGSIATITNATLSGNKATAGNGGAVWTSGKLTVNGSTLSGNTATPINGNSQTGTGGAVYLGKTASADTPTATIDSTTLSTNVAWLGGGVGVNSGSALTLRNNSVLDQNQATNSGGGIYNAGTATVTDSSFTGNKGALFAGGIFDGSVVATDTPALTMTGTSVSGGTAGIAGGGIAVAANSTLTASGGSIATNTAVSGGGLYVAENGTGTVTGASITGNKANGGNGAGVLNASTFTVTNTTLSGNQATQASGNNQTGLGGAIYSGSGQANAVVKLTVDADTLTGNTAGAGSALVTSGSVLVTRSTVHANASAPGAGVIASFGTMSIAQSTITDNTAASGSGGIYGFSATTGITGSILTGNSGANCGNAGVIDGGYNLTAPGDASCAFGAPKHDVIADPQLGALANNGGPTQTRLPAPSSPAINVIPVNTATTLANPIGGGTITLCTPGSKDQRDTTRPQGALCDIGSVEVVNVAPVIEGPDSATTVVGQPVSVTFTTTGVPTPHLGITGTLPTGVTFTENGNGTATISGTPGANTGGTYSVTITASNGTSPNATHPFTLTVNQPPTVTGADHATFTVGLPGTVSFGSTGFPTAALSVAGTLPTGVTFTDNGDGTATLAGTPEVGTEGSYPLTITANNGVTPNGTLSFTLTVLPALEVTTTSLPDGKVGEPYHASLGAQYGSAPYHWSVTSGSLPSGLTLADDGTISGTPTGPVTTSTFTVTVADSGTPQQTASKQLSITINRGPTTLTVDPVLLTVNPLKLTIGTVSATLNAGTPPNLGQPIPGQTIIFKAGNTTVCTATTDANGHASCVMSVVNTLLVIASGGVTAFYNGNALWEPSSGSAGLIQRGVQAQ
ncbi:MAG TPA: right-handed parallel beta-helix repeat-containing protein [Jatrophihabitantaceae bacterium]|nr:right-handed parallel beta-helix repeat-containing protein [Jatrophihabitantaceae bacterium]